MKICVLGLRGIPHVIGGVETHCEQLIPRLQKRRLQDRFTVIGRKAYCPRRTYEYDGVEVIALTHVAAKRLEAISNALVGLFYARFCVGAEILHIQAIGPALVTPIAKGLGMKVIVTYHAPDYKRDCFNAFAKAVLRIGEFCALRFADQVIVVSPSLAEHLKARYRSRSSRISFIPNGATHMLQASVAEMEDPLVLKRFGLEPGKYVISVGRLAPEKRFEDVIRSFRSTNSPSKLVIVGKAAPDDPYAAFLRNQADERVVFTGYLNQAEITVLLRQASLFVLASRHEGLPIAALEAAILGCPLLLSDIQPNLDLGLGAIHYFKVGDVDDLREKLALPHETFRAESKSILQSYDWDEISERTSAVYSALLAEHQTPALARSTSLHAVAASDPQCSGSVKPWREFIRHPVESLGRHRYSSWRGKRIYGYIHDLLRHRVDPGKVAASGSANNLAVMGAVGGREPESEQ